MKNLFNNSLFIWGIFIAITIAIFVFFLSFKDLHFGGDIIEYYGTTVSLLNHGTPNLTLEDQKQLEKILNPAYLNDPGWYIEGKDGGRYPVHFIFYSLLNLPALFLLKTFGLNPLDSLRITNLLIFSGATFFLFKKFVHEPFKRLILLSLLLLSPIVSFLIWPGPDVFYTMSLLLAVYLFFDKKFIPAILLTILASWQSQPLMIFAIGLIGYWGVSKYQKEQTVQNIVKTLAVGAGFTFLLFIPYIYNYLAFGVMTPWTLFENEWTRKYGFGLHNASLQKLFEQFFDLNIGLFWYAPGIFVAGIYFIKKELRDKRILFLLGALLVTAFIYQTNPAWNYGTSGFGPTRHALFLLPVLIFFIVKHIQPKQFLLLAVILLSQLFIHSFNGFLAPNFLKALDHNPYAKYVLNSYPSLYNPTPEIFTDRTNHTDLDRLTTAVYKNEGVCKKAFVFGRDEGLLLKECGFIKERHMTQEGFYVNY